MFFHLFSIFHSGSVAHQSSFSWSVSDHTSCTLHQRWRKKACHTNQTHHAYLKNFSPAPVPSPGQKEFKQLPRPDLNRSFRVSNAVNPKSNVFVLWKEAREQPTCYIKGQKMLISDVSVLVLLQLPWKQKMSKKKRETCITHAHASGFPFISVSTKDI